MELEKQVCSLGLAKTLGELGVKQESAFAWRVTQGTFRHGRVKVWGTGESVKEWQDDSSMAAFTVAELGEMLPYTDDCISRRERSGDWRCGNQIESKEADARAKMLIYLLENKLLEM